MQERMEVATIVQRFVVVQGKDNDRAAGSVVPQNGYNSACSMAAAANMIQRVLGSCAGETSLSAYAIISPPPGMSY